MTGGYDFYLGRCLLPVPPGKLQVKINNTNETVVLMNQGEVNILAAAGLTDIEFECRIPQNPYPWAVYKSGFQGADYFLGQFEALKTGRRPFQFIVCRRHTDGRKLFDTNMKVSMEEYQIVEDTEEGIDLEVKVRLKQYRDYGTKTADISFTGSRTGIQTQRETAGAPVPASAQSYRVVKGDCLWTIAKRFYGNGAKYILIHEANRDLVGSNPNRIYPGQVLVIPAG